MSISRIEHRTNPDVLADEELLPSQRSLLEISIAEKHGWLLPRYFSPQAINRLGEILAYDIALMVDETQHESGLPLTEISGTQRHLGSMARHLLEYDPKKDPYESFDRGSVKITESTSVSVYTQDGYDLFDADGKPDATGRVRFFTPEGYVTDPVGNFKQNLVTLDIRHDSTFAEDAYFDFSSKARLRLYTNNLVAQPPRWEYSTGRQRTSDMQPSSSSYPYNFHARPHLIAGEELAQSVVDSLNRVIELE